MASQKEAFFLQFYIPSEVARDCIAILGDMGNVQFKDMNNDINSFQRAFVKEIRNYDQCERKINYLSNIIKKQNINIPKQSFDHLVKLPSVDYHQFENNIESHLSSSQLDSLIEALDNYESHIKQMSDTQDDLLKRKHELFQHRMVLQNTRRFFDVRLSLELDDGDSVFNQVRLSHDSGADSFMISDDDDNDDNNNNNNDILLESGNRNNNSNIIPTGPNELNVLGSTMNFISGIIDTDKFLILEKICWRTLRGNLYINHVPLNEPIADVNSDELSFKSIFLIFTHGDSLINKCKKIIESLDGQLYSVESDYDTYKQELNTINNKLRDLNDVLLHTEERLVVELKEIALDIERWKIAFRREISIYETLNLFNYDSTRRCLIGEGWIPIDDLPYINSALKDATDRIDMGLSTIVNVIKTNKIPPTYHKTNKFTAAFQSIIDAYGIATYQEVNPGLATIVTFPFMFAIMFGDLGHGIILFLAALTLVLKERTIGSMKNRDEIFDMAYTGRYILLLMGFFSMYTGIIYNDLFSKSMTLFKSGWKWPTNFSEGELIEGTQIGVYALGLDPAWHGTDNNLLFTNSYKMKLSILMGFIHMSYSYGFALVNYRFFKSKVDIIGNFIPGLLFMQSIFGYLTLTIIYKWCIDWVAIEKPAPSLLNMLINMFLSPGTIEEQLYPGQGPIQVILVLIALVCVPWLLLYKPLTLKKINSQKIQLGYADVATSSTSNSRFSIETVISTESNNNNNNNDDLLNSSNSINQSTPHTQSQTPATTLSTDSGLQILYDENGEEPEPFEFGDVMVHQVIHTIEFCLNCVSHTASYLRLWALSLAHNQLSAVLWEMTIQNAFVPYEQGGFIGSIEVFLLFGMWFVLTVCILVVMEGTSAMLHSLRLHWVEAMSKFFEGEGYAYEPFSFYKILTDMEAAAFEAERQ
ncbi:H(+)-transporting V0 sector ATPase subunit a [Pichia californica]|uniref:V-type proton ATPase subunit a n=1 Tax=Pichia californica TaxID=460514 RepID=A0A9P6WLG2_9ASCO|nr:H(+)-transporting V0 sector ATPase subunit a [[Candida] californica]KAG0689286.1 H(+)-transporting V0 sector ATPase subunit a [[Candida] californica]